MAYAVYLDGIRLPVTPETITFSAENRNRTQSLLSGGEASVLKPPGLRTVSLTALLPRVRYPFAHYPGGFHRAEYYTEKFRDLKQSAKPFPLLITRLSPRGLILNHDSATVSLEEYEEQESAGEGMDVMVRMTLREYRAMGLKTVSQDGTQTQQASAQSAGEAETAVQYYTVKTGDCLWNICKKYLGDGSRCWDIAKLNGISNPNLIYPGQVIRLG